MMNQEQVTSRINEIVSEYKNYPLPQETLHDNVFGRLASLYEVLGQTENQAIDSASVAMGGDPIDWS